MLFRAVSRFSLVVSLYRYRPGIIGLPSPHTTRVLFQSSPLTSTHCNPLVKFRLCSVAWLSEKTQSRIRSYLLVHALWNARFNRLVILQDASLLHPIRENASLETLCLVQLSLSHGLSGKGIASMLASFLISLVYSVSDAHAGLLPTKSGNFQEMDDPCQQYSLCGSKGFTYWQDLTKTLTAPYPMDKPDDFDLYRNWYICTLEDRSGGGQQIEEDLINRGFSPVDNYKMWHVSSLQSKNGQADEETSYENMFNTDDGVIIATYNWRPLDSQKKLQWYSKVSSARTFIDANVEIV